MKYKFLQNHYGVKILRIDRIKALKTDLFSIMYILIANGELNCVGKIFEISLIEMLKINDIERLQINGIEKFEMNCIYY